MNTNEPERPVAKRRRVAPAVGDPMAPGTRAPVVSPSAPTVAESTISPDVIRSESSAPIAPKSSADAALADARTTKANPTTVKKHKPSADALGASLDEAIRAWSREPRGRGSEATTAVFVRTHPRTKAQLEEIAALGDMTLRGALEVTVAFAHALVVTASEDETNRGG